MNQPYARVNQPYATLTLAWALREMFGVQLYKNNARALLSRILSILNLVVHAECMNDNLFRCSAHWNTQKTCWDNSVDIGSFIVDLRVMLLFLATKDPLKWPLRA